jgi:uncharacterized protein (TIGR02611 family)
LIVGQDETGSRLSLIERVRARQERHRQRNRVYRVAFAVLGFVVLFAGLIMLVTPGPGIPVVIIGLGMLALEFAWAERWLERLLEKAEAAVEQVARGNPWQRALLGGIGALAVVALVAIIVLWDVPYFPG